MFSRHVRSIRRGGSERRGSVLILVVGVLAMLFVIGATQLMVARFEKQSAERKVSGSNLRGVAAMVYSPMAELFQNDALAATNSDLDPALQDSADFAGSATDLTNYVNWLSNNGTLPIPTGFTSWNEYRDWLELTRSGDSLLASSEPYWDLQYNSWRWFATSLGLDALTNRSDLRNVATNRTLEPRITNGSAVYPGTDQGDADADGVTDSRKLDISLSSVFGGQYQMYQRAMGHGGMVMLDRSTHPALLAQVIHPRDLAVHTNPIGVFSSNGIAADRWSRTATDEARLRRRYMLPESTSPSDTSWASLPSIDLRKIMPYTLGYSTGNSSFRDYTPHWWPVGSDYTKSSGEQQWWNDHMRPVKGINEQGYSATNDSYDRRHLMTVYSYDDLLRPQRNEWRLLRFPNPTGTPAYYPADFCSQYFYAINPETSSRLDEYNAGAFKLETQARQPLQAGGFNPLAYPLAYGMMPDVSGWSLQFNRPGLRTPFSLRDTLVLPNPTKYPTVDEAGTAQNWTYQASLRRAAQLTGYYLAMIQNTTVPGAARAYNAMSGTTNPTTQELQKQIDTALQLAVNTIDFADNADVNGDGLVVRDIEANGGDIRWDNDGAPGITNLDLPIDPLTAMSYNDGTKTHTFYGFEKQPFLTEAYVKLVYLPFLDGTAYKWTTTASATESIYAVELYNPYMEPLYLHDYILKTAGGEVDLAKVMIPAQSYVVISNVAQDVSDLTTAAKDLFPGQNTIVPTQTTDPYKNLYLVDGTDLTGTLRVEKDGAQLLRKTVLHLEVDPNTSLWRARLDRTAKVQVDTIVPSSVGTKENAHAYDNRFAAVPWTAMDYARPVEKVNDNYMSDRLVWDSSIQRRKETRLSTFTGPLLAGQFPPTHWQFTLSSQVVFPLPWFEHPQSGTSSAVLDTHPGTRPMQHNLLGSFHFTYNYPVGGLMSNQAVVGWLMDGRELSLTLPTSITPPLYPMADGRPGDQAPTAEQRLVDDPLIASDRGLAFSRDPIAPVQLVTSDMGLDAMGRCRAYPTTGTLLLVSRYAHKSESDGTNVTYKPISTTVTGSFEIVDQQKLGYAALIARSSAEQMLMTDNGHLPIFDTQQVVLGEPRRLQMPWGQMVYDYFTALPIEELFEYRNLSGFVSGATNVRLIDLYEQYPKAFEDAYKFIVNGRAPAQYGSSPVQDVVTTDGVNTIGPKVRGRINVNMAPWWVLDGLPMLADAYYPPNNASYNLLESLPVAELVTTALDPSDYTVKPAAGWMNTYVAEPSSVNNAGWPTLDADLARYIVSYREKRLVEGQGPALGVIGDDNSFQNNPGYTSVGTLCDVARRIPLSFTYGTAQVTAVPVGMLRYQRDPANPTSTSADKPFAYLGYMQLVTPLVRLQDWTTVKSHVYTIYNVVGDSSEPPVWLRSQTTIDRTRCLYTNDLPDRIVQTEPIAYSNSVSDQQ